MKNIYKYGYTVLLTTAMTLASQAVPKDFDSITKEEISKLSVSNIYPIQITNNSAKISWNVSEYSTGQVEYGETTAYGHFNKKETSFKYNHHEQSLSNLTECTTYHYRVISENENAESITSNDYSFQTHCTLSLNNIHPMNITSNSAKIFWDVSQYSTGQVEYGETTAYGNFNKKETSFNYNHHEQLLANLKPETLYHYRVISEDSEGNKVVSGDYTFTTLSDNVGYADLGNYTPKFYTNNKEGNNKYIAYYPENGIHADMPVVMFIKGGGSATIEGYSGIMKFMASKGYFVIGVDTNSYDSWYVTKYLNIALNEVKAKYGLTVSKLAIMGHSLGGGEAIYAMKKFRDDGYGSEGSLALSIDGWFTFNMNEADLNQLDTKVSFLQMHGVHGTGTDPRIDLKIWNLSTQADKSFYTLTSTNHSYVAGSLENVLGKKDLLLTIGALTDDAFNGGDDGAEAIPESNKATYSDIFNALKSEDSYHGGDCKGIQYNAISVIKNNDIDYCDLDASKKYPEIMKVKDILTLDKNALPKPDIGEEVIDDILGTKIIRIRDRNKKNIYLSAYPKIQSWNIDMSLLRIGQRIYNGHTYEETTVTRSKDENEVHQLSCSTSPSDIRWSNNKNEANIFYLTRTDSANQNIPTFFKGVIKNNTIKCEKIRTFSTYKQVYLTLGEGNIANNNYVAMVGIKENDSKVYIILYDIKSNTIKWEKALDLDITNKEHIDWVSLSPSGKYIVVNTSHNYDISDRKQGIYIYKNTDNEAEALENPVQLTYKNTQNETIPIYPEHGDVGIDSNGNEVWVQFMFAKGYNDTQGIYMFKLSTPNQPGEAVVTSSNFNGGHIGCHNTNHLNWCTISPYNNNYNHVFRLRLRALKDIQNETEKENVQVFSKMYRRNNFYETYGASSPDGTKVIFNSYWGTNMVSTFIAEVK